MNLGHKGEPCPYNTIRTEKDERAAHPSNVPTGCPLRFSLGNNSHPQVDDESLPLENVGKELGLQHPVVTMDRNPLSIGMTSVAGIQSIGGTPNTPEGGQPSSEWDFDPELPQCLPDDGDESMDEEETFDNRLEQVESGLLNSEMGMFNTPPEAQPFDSFAFRQAGAEKGSIAGVKVLVLIHRNGVHRLPIRWCRCPGHPTYDLQALDLGLFPASFKKIRTLFTFEVLDDFLAENQECKSSAWHYFQKLRRFSCSSFPHTVPVTFYNELLTILHTHLMLALFCRIGIVS